MWRPAPSSVRAALAVSLLPALAAALAYLFFYAAHDRGFFARIVDPALDQRMALLADRPAAQSRPPVVMLDFDDRTMAALHDPVTVPPPKLAAALDRLSEARPWAVLIDLDVAYLPEGPDLRLVARSLSNLAKRKIPVLLARDLLPPLPGQGLGRWRPTPLSGPVDSSPNLIWVATSLAAGQDGVTRHFPTMQAGLLDQSSGEGRVSQPRVLPAAAVVALLLRQEGSLPRAKRALDPAEGGSSCAYRTDRSATRGTVVCRGDRPLELELTPDAAIRLTRSWPAGGIVYPALGLLRRDAPVDLGAFADRLVVVGSSAGSRDFTQTPLGPMPGAFVHVNILRSWLGKGPEEPFSFWSGLAVMLLATSLIGFLFHLIMRTLPRNHRPRARFLAPPLLAGTFWLFFLIWTPSVSIGLVALIYVLVSVITVVQKKVERHPSTRHAYQRRRGRRRSSATSGA